MKTILLIDGDSHIAENLKEGFELQGYKILLANSGIVGVNLAKEHIPDLIICEILISEIDGYEVLRLLSSETKTKNIPFIFGTCMAEKIDKEKAIKLGSDDFIVKPYGFEPLFEMAKKWI